MRILWKGGFRVIDFDVSVGILIERDWLRLLKENKLIFFNGRNKLIFVRSNFKSGFGFGRFRGLYFVSMI